MSEDGIADEKSHFYRQIGFRCLLLIVGCLIAGGASWVLGAVLEPWVPIWFPAGVGFLLLLRWGLKYAPALFLASVLSYWVVFLSIEDAYVRWIGICFGSLGVVISSCVGVVLVRRILNWPGDLRAGRGIARLVLFSGLIGPLAGSVAVFPAWSVIGLVPSGDGLMFWCVLVASYAIGVVTVALPLLMLGPEFERQGGRRRILLFVPMSLALVASADVLWFVGGVEKRQIQSQLARETLEATASVQEEISQHLETLYSLRSFWEGSDWVSREEFLQFTERTLIRNDGFEMLGWVPAIRVDEEALLDADLAKVEGLAELHDVSLPFWFSDQANVQEEELPKYPLWYVVPSNQNLSWIGADLAFDPAMLEAIKRSRKSGVIAAALPVEEPGSGEHFFFSCLWIKERELPKDPDGEWLQHRGGCVVALIRLDKIVGDVVGRKLKERLSGEMVLSLVAAPFEAGSEEVVSYRFDSVSDGDKGLKGYVFDQVLEVADREWMLSYAPQMELFGELITWQLPSAQLGVLLLTGMLGILVLTATGYAARIEREVKERTFELAESEAKFRQLSETVSEVFWIFSIEDGKFDYVSPSFEKVWNEPAEKVCEDPYVWYYLILEEDRAAARAAFEGAISEEEDYDVEYRIRRRDGVERWIRDRGFPVKGDDGSVVRLVGVADDITEARLAQQDLVRSNADLESFAYLASHDLQEPLRMVTSFVQLLQKRYGEKMGDEADEYISQAVSGTERMRRLINGLLALSRVESRDLVVEPVESELLVRDAIDDLQVAIAESEASVTIEGDFPIVRGGRAQLTQVFQNLIGNAVKHRSPDRVPTIVVSVDDRNDRYEFSVVDNGPGIEERDFDRIFEIFQRLKPATEEKGTGIGLSLCRRIVEKHGGSIWLGSEVGKGSSFTFSLPKGESVFGREGGEVENSKRFGEEQ